MNVTREFLDHFERTKQDLKTKIRLETEAAVDQLFARFLSDLLCPPNQADTSSIANVIAHSTPHLNQTAADSNVGLSQVQSVYINPNACTPTRPLKRTRADDSVCTALNFQDSPQLVASTSSVTYGNQMVLNPSGSVVLCQYTPNGMLQSVGQSSVVLSSMNVSNQEQLANQSSVSEQSLILEQVESDTSVKLDEEEQKKSSGRIKSFKIKTIKLKCLQEDCGLMFATKQEHDQHMSEMHGIEPFRCFLAGCQQSFVSQRRLTPHIRNDHANVPQDQWKCCKCERQFKDHKILQKHIYFTHQEGHFECAREDCDFTGTNRGQVFSHFQTAHQHLTCSFDGCGKTFAMRHDLEVHECMHMGVKPCHCQFAGCEKSFRTQKELKEHLRTHTGARPYRCKWQSCRYDCTQRSGVIRHIRVVHFGLPGSVREQKQRNIVDHRNAKDYLEVVHNLLHAN